MRIEISGYKALEIYMNSNKCIPLHSYGNGFDGGAGLRDICESTAQEIEREDIGLLYIETDSRRLDWKDVSNHIQDLLGSEATKEDAAKMRQTLEDGGWLFSEDNRPGSWILIQPDLDQWLEMVSLSNTP